MAKLGGYIGGYFGWLCWVAILDAMLGGYVGWLCWVAMLGVYVEWLCWGEWAMLGGGGGDGVCGAMLGGYVGCYVHTFSIVDQLAFTHTLLLNIHLISLRLPSLTALRYVMRAFISELYYFLDNIALSVTNIYIAFMLITAQLI